MGGFSDYFYTNKSISVKNADFIDFCLKSRFSTEILFIS